MKKSPTKGAQVLRRDSEWDRYRDICIDVQDNSISVVPAAEFLDVDRGLRDRSSTAARLATQFIQVNRALLSEMDVRMEPHFDGSLVQLMVKAGNSVGAVPLVSPVSSRHDFGLVIRPRFAWGGIGVMLSEMGWKITPKPLRLPLLKRSERRVPAWVLSSMILARLKTLLGSLQGRFETVEEDIPTMRGRVDWSRYARVQLPRGKGTELPCTYSDFRKDRSLLSAIRYALEIQMQSLNTQRHHGLHVHRLIELCVSLLQITGRVPASPPVPSQIAAWMRRPLRAEALSEGVLAIEWTLEGRGLAGTNELAGVPWVLSMDQFFEAWVETVFGEFGRRLGATMRSARSDGTRQRIRWTPRYAGAQESLVPDLVLEHAETTWIVDAKYKRHWEEWRLGIWSRLDEELRNEHRHDFHQILSYANLSRTEKTIACLCYPCEPSTWKEMQERNRVLHRAYIPSAQRSLEIWVTAIPMDTAVNHIADLLLTQAKQLV